MTPQSAIFGFSDVHQGKFLVSNQFLLLIKHFIYISRDSNILLFPRVLEFSRKFTLENKKRVREKRNYFIKNDKKFRINYSFLKTPVT